MRKTPIWYLLTNVVLLTKPFLVTSQPQNHDIEPILKF